MAYLSATDAAKAAGVSVHTIYRKAKAGLLSYTLDNNGNKQFDAAELVRCFGSLVDSANADEKSGNVTQQQTEIDLLRVQLAASQQMLEQQKVLIAALQDNVKDLRLMLPSPAQKKKKT